MLEKHGLLEVFRFNEPITYGILDKPDILVDDLEQPFARTQLIYIEKPEDWKDFYTKFYNKQVY